MRQAVAAFLLFLFPALGWAQPPVEQPVAAADAKAVREAIEAQLDAFRKSDAKRAYSYAAPAIREMYDNPEEFMEMVRSFYKVVFRPASVVFQPPVRVGKDLVQPVRLTDSEGRAWMAYYPMVRGPDGRWLINGCRLSRLGGQET
jgi:hypothetical protein